MKKEKKEKSILSLIAKNTTSAVGGYALDKLSDATSGIRKRLDPRNIARQMAGPGLLGDVAEGLTSGAMKAIGFGAKKLFGLASKKKKDPRYTTISNGPFGAKKLFGLASKKKKDPRYTTISNGPIRPLKLGDSVADILGKMYNFMLKTDQVYKLNDEIERAFRQEQLDEDGRRHKALVKAIKDFTKKYKKDNTKEKEEKGGFLDTILNGLKLWALELLAGLLPWITAISAALVVINGIKIPRVPKGAPRFGDKPKVPTNTKDEKTSPKPTTTNPAQENKKTPKNTKTPAQRRSEPKTRSGSSKAERISRNTKAPPTPTTAQKVGQGALKGLKLGNSAVLKGLNGLLDLLNKVPGLKSLAIGADLIGEIQDLANEAFDPNRKSTNDEIVFKAEKIFAKFLGGRGGMELGGLIGASVGTTVGGPWGTLIGGFSGAAIGTEMGEELGGALFVRYATGKWPEIDYPKAIQYATDHGFVIGEGGAAFGTNAKGIKKKTFTPIPVPTSNKTIPMSYENRLGLASGENVVAVNNSVKNIGGKPSRVLSTNSAKQRNSDLDRFLSNSSVVV